MPRGGSKPGDRRGGRIAGRKNKRTLEKLAEASREAGDKARAGKKFAKEALDELMVTAMAFAAREQRRIIRDEREVDADGIPVKRADQQTYDHFWKAMECAGIFARALAPFQHPTFKAIAVIPPPPEIPNRPDPKTIDGKVVRLDDPIEVARIYQQLIRRVG